MKQVPANRVPILLTSSVVAHDTGVALTDTDERIRLTLESVEQWLKIDPTLPIVLCDGSSFDFSGVVREKFPSAQIECLQFENDQAMVRQYGRGYGEGEIVRHAVDHSKLIAEAGCFAKCTSKLWVANFPQCLTLWNGELLCKGVFLDVFSPFKKTRFAYIDTRFYIASCAAYKKHFENAHFRIDRSRGYGLEECFHQIFLEHKITRSLFSIPPVICGVGGGTGVYYKNPIVRMLKEQLRLRLVRANSRFAHLFSDTRSRVL